MDREKIKECAMKIMGTAHEIIFENCDTDISDRTMLKATQVDLQFIEKMVKNIREELQQ
jgi:tRNA isopentenyl-2-thiomethyl-A-37 hydroxylase MiaE